MSQSKPVVIPSGAKKPDKLALIIGPPKAGKSSLLAQLALERVAAGSWVFAQDNNREMEHLGPRFLNTAEWLIAAREADANKTPIAKFASIICPEGADELVDLAMYLGNEWNAKHGTVRHPFCVALNEFSSLEKSGPTHIGKKVEQLIARRRHFGVELIFNCQRPNQITAGAWEYVTDVFMFRQSRSDRIDWMENTLGLARGTLRELATLPPHHYRHWQPGNGMVKTALW